MVGGIGVYRILAQILKISMMIVKVSECSKHRAQRTVGG